MSARRNASEFQIRIHCTAPLHHGAFEMGDTGNAVLFRRLPLASDPSVSVPVVSGNALRGALRRVIMRDLLALCDLRLGGDLPPVSWDKLYAAVANGGHLESAEARVDPEAQRRLREAVPALSVLGAALYHSMLAGRVSIGWLWPVCRETIAAGLVPAPDPLVELPRAEDLIAEIGLVRHVDRDQQDTALSGVTPMPVTVEALVPGTVLMGSIIQLGATTPTELGAIGWGLNELCALGGKSGAGFGRIAIEHHIPSEAYEQWRADAAAVTLARAALMGIVGYAAPAKDAA